MAKLCVSPYVTSVTAKPPRTIIGSLVIASGRWRPRMIPAHRNASHGSSGWVPLTNVSNSRPRGERPVGLNSQAVERRSWRCSNAHHWSAAPAMAAAAPMTAIHLLRRVKISAPTMKYAP